MFGAGWFGFKTTQELDSWCITQMQKAQKSLQPMFEMAFDPNTIPRLMIMSLLRMVHPDARPETDSTLRTLSVPPLATHRSLDAQYDDETWMAMLCEEEEAKQKGTQHPPAGAASALSAASTVLFHSPSVTPDSAQSDASSVGLHSALLSSVHNLFTRKPLSPRALTDSTSSSSRPAPLQPPFPFMDPPHAPLSSHGTWGDVPDKQGHVPAALIPELDYQVLVERSQASGLPDGIDAGGVYLL